MILSCVGDIPRLSRLKTGFSLGMGAASLSLTGRGATKVWEEVAVAYGGFGSEGRTCGWSPKCAVLARGDVWTEV